MKSVFSLSLLMFAAGALAASPTQISLNFDDNQIPFEWSLFVPSPGTATNYGIANGHFYAGATSNRAILLLPYLAAKKTKNITVEWTGSIFQNGYVSQQAAQFQGIDSLYTMARVTTNTSGNGGGVLVELGTPDGSQSAKLSLPDGNYQFKAEFTPSGLTFSGSLNGTLMFKETRSGSIPLQKLSNVQLFVYETVGPDTWMDDVKITQFACKKPVNGAC